MTTGSSDLQRMTVAELMEEAHRVGIPFVQHMSTQELIEAIEQQRETNALHPEETVPMRRRVVGGATHGGSLPRGWENFPG